MLYTTSNNTFSVHNENIKSLRENVSLIANLNLSQWDYGHYLILEGLIEDIDLFKETFKEEITPNERLSLLFIENQALLTKIRLYEFHKEDEEAKTRFDNSKEEYKDTFVF